VGNVVPPSIALAFVTKMSKKRKSTSLGAIQVQNWWKTNSTDKKLEVITWFEKGERIVDICHNVRFIDNSMHTVCDNDDRITESA